MFPTYTPEVWEAQGPGSDPFPGSCIIPWKKMEGKLKQEEINLTPLKVPTLPVRVEHSWFNHP